MAIYHLTASVISRARGHRIVAIAANHSGTKLRDDYYGITHNHSQKAGVLHVEILAPAESPAWVRERALLWNRVEAAEHRKDSQLARALEISLPLELSNEQNIELLREYLVQGFVRHGMVADFSVRCITIGNPHANVLLTLRAMSPEGFGLKARHWNRKNNILEWRAAWAECTNRHLARAGHDIRIDHRSLEGQQIELVAGRRTGIKGTRSLGRKLPNHLQQRIDDRQRIAAENGAAMIEDPSLALRAIARQRNRFTEAHLVQFLRSRTADTEQLEAVRQGIMNSPELVALAVATGEAIHFTSRDLVEAEKSLMRRVAIMSLRGIKKEPPGHTYTSVAQPLDESSLIHYLISGGDFKALKTPTDTNKYKLLTAASKFWHAQGHRIMGVALSNRAVADFQALHIDACTWVSFDQAWLDGQDLFASSHVIVVMGAEMIALKSLERIIAAADKLRAKLVLMADAEQFVGTLSPLHSLIVTYGPRA